MAGERLRYGGAIAALIVASCFLYLAPIVPQVTIDHVLLRAESHVSGSAASPQEMPAWVAAALEFFGGADFIARNLWLPALLMVLITLCAGVFTHLRGRWSAYASESVIRRVRDRVYDHFNHLPVRYYDRAETGDLIQRATSDVETLRLFLSTQVVEVGRASIMLLVPLPLMWSIDPRMMIASVLFVPVIVVSSFVYFLRVKKAFKATDEAEGRMTTTIQENLTGIRVVRAFARQDFERQRFEERNRDHRNCDMYLYGTFAWFWSSSDLLCFGQKGLVVGYGAWLLSRGELQVGAFFYFLTAVGMFLWPVRMVGRILSDFGKALVALQRLQEILDEPTEHATVLAEPGTSRSSSGDAGERDGIIPAAPLSGRLRFEDVVFRHGETAPVLRGISFAAEPGETIGILGPSGCGKSTVVNLLLRLYDHDAGSIRLDDHDLKSLDRKFVRSQLAVVLQEPFLYSKSIRENIVMSRPEATEEEMIGATSIARVHESILRFDQAYSTRVGERGVTLSGGQRQRIALARALLQKPALLILDDAMSAVDAETESQILEALRHRRGRHTTILIAHRIATLMHADRILVMEKGQIVDAGRHEDLVKRPGLYQRLWKIQNAADVERLPGAHLSPHGRNLVAVAKDDASAAASAAGALAAGAVE